ncbi:MAG: hypothetical protein ABSD98_19155 [Candidatus Korobacteraceae bacterium]
MAFPFGSFGRPAFFRLFCGFKASKLLYDCRSYCILSRFDRVEVQYRDVMARIAGIARIVRPRIDSVRCRMIFQVEYLYDAFPNGFTLKGLFDGYALDVLRFDTVQAPDNVPQFRNVFLCFHSGHFI